MRSSMSDKIVLPVICSILLATENDGSSGFDHDGPESQQSSEAVLWWLPALKN
jgi:hypothetical protein